MNRVELIKHLKSNFENFISQPKFFLHENLGFNLNNYFLFHFTPKNISKNLIELKLKVSNIELKLKLLNPLILSYSISPNKKSIEIAA